MRGGCGGLAGRVHSRYYPGEGWGRYGEVTSQSRTLKTVQNAARTTHVGSGVSWFVTKEMISKKEHNMKLRNFYVTVWGTDVNFTPGRPLFKFKNFRQESF
jgi:hypothetical protein